VVAGRHVVGADLRDVRDERAVKGVLLVDGVGRPEREVGAVADREVDDLPGEVELDHEVAAG
jgi:hypothetical protein